ncbi:hypothetical protein AVEN_94377-1 [Araneus ventricosus]|uniref:Uncharacterized protein n=1 Tax=Araneus ventricosus TaxID=182803 RepID=A0A4Y2EAZ2_ARAVE|nr:hypothetical protein AVEN_94377-1 [Araneus ventricosus]
MTFRLAILQGKVKFLFPVSCPHWPSFSIQQKGAILECSTPQLAGMNGSFYQKLVSSVYDFHCVRAYHVVSASLLKTSKCFNREVQNMEKLSCSLTCRNFELPNAASVVRCSSVMQKSLCALNLSVLEFSLYKKHITKSSRKPPNFLKVFFYREEEIRKFLVKDRKILYCLHLDLPLEREPSLRDADFADFLVDSRSFHIGSVSLPNFWYQEKLQEFVLQSVKLSNEKLLTLSRILKNERKIHSYWESSLCVIRYDLGVICFESNHTGIAKGAIIRFDVRETTLDISPKVSEIYTYGGFQAQGHVDHDIYILHEMIIDCTFEFIPSLLRHGFALKFDDKGYKQLQESLM